ncbi:response regulator transcription factor [Clostridium saccharoperbutylacetonicum]|uniref:response regulator transcription factor n=1 Tax=Clostridium saccharoperbutylacetonicum TaxID=36745 RepID=UPI0039E9A256
MAKILIVEDDEKLARFVELELVHEGYEILKADNGRTGLEIAENGQADLMLLDIMIPEINGLEVLRRIRKVSDLPVIMLTARDAVMDKVSGLDAGADDYITKPFAIEELLARIRSALKRQMGSEKRDSEIISCGLLSLDKIRHKVMYDNTEIELTNREFMLLKILLENKNIVLSRDILMEKVCGYDFIGETNVIDVYIRYLRTKIDDSFKIKIISTVRGVGYVIKDE